jgi:glycosyltransferase involved in cell wall biosynthesis
MDARSRLTDILGVVAARPVTTMDERRVMMIQQGARRNYVYARQLEAAGLLHSLVSDAAWPAGDRGWPTRIALGLAPRLSGPRARRSAVGIPRSRLRASILPNLALVARRFMRDETAFAFADEALALPNRLRGLGGADIIVNYHGNGGSFLSWAKRQGAKVVTDFVITPKYLEIEQRERLIWPGWDPDETPQPVIDSYRARMARLVALSDLYLCPSQTVARDLADLPGFHPARVRLLPYGVSGVLLRQARPERGRVLFAGAAGLRKGVPYLAQAAALLKARRPDIEIIVAGAVSPAVRRQPLAGNLTFLGHLDSEHMAEEFARADLFCLPSLAEGSATSIYEALANGLPIVTTESSGSIVRDGVEGLIVRERDSAAIANAIVRIAADRNLRASMSAAALAAADWFSEEACGRAFIHVIRELAAKPPVVHKTSSWT